MIQHLIYFVIMLVILVKGSDFFIDSSSNIAKKLGVSEFIIGLTLVAMGTSLPELLSSIFAAVQKTTDLAIGDIVGSNIANVCLIIGISAILFKIKTHEKMVKRDGYILLFVSLLLFLTAILGYFIFYGNKLFYFIVGIFYLFLFVVYILFLYESKHKEEEKLHFKEFLNYILKFKYFYTIHKKIFKKNNKVKRKNVKILFRESLVFDFLVSSISGIAIFFGAKYMILEAVWFSKYFGVSSNFIGLTIIALGTSLPELSVALSSAKKGFGDILMGNIIGSNIFNIVLVLGVCSLIYPLNFLKSSVFFTIPFMIMSTILLLFFIRSNWYIKKVEGFILLLMYFLFLVLIVFLQL